MELCCLSEATIFKLFKLFRARYLISEATVAAYFTVRLVIIECSQLVLGLDFISPFPKDRPLSGVANRM